MDIIESVNAVAKAISLYPIVVISSIIVLGVIAAISQKWGMLKRIIITAVLIGIASTIEHSLKYQILPVCGAPKWITARPISAKDCNLWNSGGDFSKVPGFPSGHSTFAWLVAGLAFATAGHTNVWIVVFALLAAIATSISRVVLHCHTVSQVIAGGVLGITVAGFGNLLLLQD